MAAEGSGLRHMFWVLRRYSANHDIQQAALRLLADTGIDNKVEARVFALGGTDLAMQIGRQAGVPEETRAHAARFFFNLTYNKATRMEVVKKGGLDHIAFLVLDEPATSPASVGLGLRMVRPTIRTACTGLTCMKSPARQLLSTAKALVMLALVEDIRPLIMEHPRMQATLLKIAIHSDKQVWLRAAKVIKSLALDEATRDRLKKWEDVTASLYGMDEDNSFVKQCQTALWS